MYCLVKKGNLQYIFGVKFNYIIIYEVIFIEFCEIYVQLKKYICKCFFSD